MWIQWLSRCSFRITHLAAVSEELIVIVESHTLLPLLSSRSRAFCTGARSSLKKLYALAAARRLVA